MSASALRSVKISFSASMRNVVSCVDPVELDVEAGTVSAVLRALDHERPGVLAALLDDRGGLRHYLRIILNRVMIGDLDQEVADRSDLLIISAFAGG